MQERDSNYFYLKAKQINLQNLLVEETKAERISFLTNNKDRNTSYHLSSHKQRTKSPLITTIQDNDTPDIIHQGEKATEYIHKFFSDFYQRPSHTPNGTIEDFLSDIPPDIIRKLPEEIITKLERPIHDEEVDFIVNKQHKGSAPGPSGSTYGLLKSIYPIIRPVVRRFAKESIDKDSLSPISRLRKIIGIPKPNKPTDQIGSIRPICLLEIPYKIISGIIAERLKNASSFIIDEQQNGYTANRGIQLATRTIQDIRDLALKKNIPLTILGLDFSSAFDRISHTFLFHTMKFFKFPDKFINMLKTLMKNPLIQLQMNGLLSETFSQTDAGSGQGDCVSSYLFSLCIQILIIKLSHSPAIDRFTLNYTNSIHKNVEKQFHVIAFADDCHVPLSPKHHYTLHNTLNVLQRFSELSDLILNVKKLNLWLLVISLK